MRCFSPVEEEASDTIDRESFTMNQAANTLKEILEASSPIRRREFVVFDIIGRGELKFESNVSQNRNASKSSLFISPRRVSENLSKVFTRGSAETASE
ncbi:unnamed protein product [Agarophyton chilense]